MLLAQVFVTCVYDQGGFPGSKGWGIKHFILT
jgi:hypothetical protein